MSDETGALARSITWAGSKQTYFTILLLVDRDLISDAYRAYAYFRWIDDVIDELSQSKEKRISFTKKQKELIDGLYRNEKFHDLIPEEKIIAELINSDKNNNSGLKTFINNMFAIIEFDAYRKGRLISQKELTWYSDCLSKSINGCGKYFIGNDRPYPDDNRSFLTIIAAHITHMLRDMVNDTADGFVNIPIEYLEVHGISPGDINSTPYREWVKNRVGKAWHCFDEGKTELVKLNILRRKLAGFWYCARFESILDAIEKDGYILRETYKEHRKLSTLVKIIWSSIYITLKHLT